MAYYFKLQHLFLIRLLAGLGPPPLVGFCIVLFMFIGGSLALFNLTAHAGYVYALLALYLLHLAANGKRTGLIRSIFSSGEARLIRMLENLAIVFPFLPFLFHRGLHWEGSMLISVALILGGVNVQGYAGKVIPTPFGTRPFEAIIGTRTMIIFLLVCYALCLIAVVVGNFNLGIFSLLLAFGTVMSFHLEPEKEYFVWIYDRTPKGFLFEKILTALFSATVLTVPIISMLLLFHFEEIGKIVLFLLLGHAYLIMIVLAKYASFPEPISLRDSVLIAMSLLLPPVLLAIIPWFYSRAIGRTGSILG